MLFLNVKFLLNRLKMVWTQSLLFLVIQEAINVLLDSHCKNRLKFLGKYL